MAPKRKSKGVHKQLSKLNEVSPNKGGGNSNNSRQRKRKMSDMLGSQWSKGELQLFYEAYRKLGKNWKKVANSLRNRSIAMVEALYNMNQAYLALPEGTASVVGLIAMMTDHYNVMEESKAVQEGTNVAGLNQKFNKRARGNARSRISRENSVQSKSVATSDGCLSILKMRHSKGRAVGKRTPRIPVSYSYKNDEEEMYMSSIKRGGNPESNSYDDNNNNAHVAALWLAEASRRESSPRLTRTSYTKTLSIKDSERTDLEELHGTSRDESVMEDWGSKALEDGYYVRESGLLVDSDLVTDDTRQMERQLDGLNNNSADIDVLNSTEGLESTSPMGIVYIAITKEKHVHPSLRSEIKRSNKCFSEGSAFDGLLALADMSLLMSSSTMETGDSISSSHQEEKTNSKTFTGFEVTSFGVSNLGREMPIQLNSPLEQKMLETTNKWKRKGKLLASKSKKEKVCATSHISEYLEKKVSTNVEAVTPTKQSRRKNNPKKIWTQRDTKSGKKTFDEQLTPQGTTFHLKEKLSSLSSIMLRKWCAFEWFYSSIDYPWFAKNEFEEYLYHVGLGHIPRLTRFEWGLIKSSLGKSRRFSEKFLQEERDKLKQYRESVRIHYAELRAGIRDGLATDLAQPLTVGQCVIALHPKTREVNDGIILTVDHDRYRVQFDHPEIGVEFVKDIDCIPLNKVENRQKVLKGQHVAANKSSLASKDIKARELLSTSERPILLENEVFKSSENKSYIPSTNHPITTFDKQMQGHTVHFNTQAKATATEIVNLQAPHNPPVHLIKSKEADVQALLKQTNSLADKISSALIRTTRDNTYRCSSIPPWLKPLPISSYSANRARSVDNFQDRNDNAVSIVKGSKVKARAMVEVAMKALFLMKEGEDAFKRVREALYLVNGGPFNGTKGHDNRLSTCQSDPSVTNHRSDCNRLYANDGNELQIPSRLITSCVATMLAIQKCTERQYPPADVVQVLDSVAGSLQPSCSQNLPIYREIQMCMGRIKTQILALIPT